LRKGGYLASGKAANIGDNSDSARENYLDEILFTPIGGAEGENPFRVWSHTLSISFGISCKKITSYRYNAMVNFAKIRVK
jgi:hypothetical protein